MRLSAAGRKSLGILSAVSPGIRASSAAASAAHGLELDAVQDVWKKPRTISLSRPPREARVPWHFF